MNSFNKVVLFATGAAIGSAVTYILMKRKYEQECWFEEEEASKDHDDEEPTEESSEYEQNDEKEDDQKEMVQYNKYVKKYSGNSLIDEMENNMKGSEDDVDRPYLITVDEYAELEDYALNSLYYYNDKVLTDEMGNPIDDVDDTVGLENLNLFDDKSIDSIYIRNDARMTDYEVLRDIGNFYEYKK